MTPARLQELLASYHQLELAVIGDYCLDRYLEIDPSHSETSIETGLPVHNVTRVRPQAGAAGTITNNLAALGVGRIAAVGFCGDDGEGFELQRALRALPTLDLEHFVVTPLRQTFTYTKPLLVAPGAAPVELNRLDLKNWSPTPAEVEDRLVANIRNLPPSVKAVIVMDQVDHPGTGVVTDAVIAALAELPESMPVIVDSRSGLDRYPPSIYKMNAAELQRAASLGPQATFNEMTTAAAGWARQQGRAIFVTLAERGILGATPVGAVAHRPAIPCRGEIDIVGAGDSVTAGLAAALAAGATEVEAMEVAMLAASITIHQLGTTGTATPAQIAALHAAQL